MSKSDHDDPRPLADDDSRLKTEDIANADRRMDDEPTDDRRVADEYQTDEAQWDEPQRDEAPRDEAPRDEVPRDEVPRDEVPQDDVPQDDVPQDETQRDEAQTRLDEAPTEQLPTQEAPAHETDDTPAELFAQPEVERFRVEWQQIQARFVDDPRDAVQSADHLVAAVMQSLATTFTNHKHELENQWQQGSDVETEDLRLALRRYRSFFNQLLNV